jgi:Zn-finger nucleic acid-binding protein
MVARSYRAVPLESCDAHGLWLDKGELEQILARQRNSSQRLHRYATRAALERGRWEGVLLDWLAFLLPDSSARTKRTSRKSKQSG